MAQDKILGEQLDIVDVAGDIAADPTATAILGTGVATDIDHNDLINSGTNTHATIDSHISDGTLHFTEASIVHQNISGAGTNTHAQIDTHIADGTIHVTTLNGLSDVNAPAPVAGEALVYAGSPINAWAPGSGGGGGTVTNPMTVDLNTGGFDLRTDTITTATTTTNVLTIVGGDNTYDNFKVGGNTTVEYNAGNIVVQSGGTTAYSSDGKAYGAYGYDGGYGSPLVYAGAPFGNAPGQITLKGGEMNRSQFWDYAGTASVSIYGGDNNHQYWSGYGGGVFVAGGNGYSAGRVWIFGGRTTTPGYSGGDVSIAGGYGYNGGSPFLSPEHYVAQGGGELTLTGGQSASAYSAGNVRLTGGANRNRGTMTAIAGHAYVSGGYNFGSSSAGAGHAVISGGREYIATNTAGQVILEPGRGQTVDKKGKVIVHPPAFDAGVGILHISNVTVGGNATTRTYTSTAIKAADTLPADTTFSLPGSDGNTDDILTMKAGSPVDTEWRAPIVLEGSGTPEGSITAPVGRLYTNTAGSSVGTILYVKTSGASSVGWSPVGNVTNPMTADLNTDGYRIYSTKGGVTIESEATAGDVNIIAGDRDNVIISADQIHLKGDAYVGSPVGNATAEVRIFTAGTYLGTQRYTSVWPHPSLAATNDFYLPDNNGNHGDVLTRSGNYTTWAPASGGVGNPLTADLLIGDGTGGYNGGFEITAPSIDAAGLPATEPNNIFIRGGNNAYTGGGYFASGVYVYGGNGTNGNYGGYLSLYGGDTDTGEAGPVNITGGRATTGYSGNVYIEGGRATQAGGTAGVAQLTGGNHNSGDGGATILRGGEASGATNVGGNVALQPGRGVSTAEHGSITIERPYFESGQGELQFWNHTDTLHTTGNYVSLKAPVFAGSPPTDIVFTLPEFDGGNGDVLQTDGAGNWSFATPATPPTLSNWLYANNGDDFDTTPIATGSNSIALGNDATTAAANIALAAGYSASATGYASIGIGANASVAGNYGIAIGLGADAQNTDSICIGRSTATNTAGTESVVIGHGNQSVLTSQTTIGRNITAASTTTNVAHSVRIGSAIVSTDKNMLHLYSKGKLELYGDEAQFIFPNYQVGSPPTAFPSTTVEGGTVYDAVAKTLKVYDGASWNYVSSPTTITVDNFADTTDYTSGTTTQLTLSVDPGTENNISVIFDGVVQHHDQYSVSGTTLTFSAAIPTGTADVEVVIGTALSAGVPSDGSVTYAKLADEVVKSHGGRITSAGATTAASAGLVITKPGTGSYLVTHNWGHTNYSPTATVDGTAVYVTIGTVSANTFEIKTYTDGTTTAVDAGFTFNVSEW